MYWSNTTSLQWPNGYPTWRKGNGTWRANGISMFDVLLQNSFAGNGARECRPLKKWNIFIGTPKARVRVILLCERSTQFCSSNNRGGGRRSGGEVGYNSFSLYGVNTRIILLIFMYEHCFCSIYNSYRKVSILLPVKRIATAREKHLKNSLKLFTGGSFSSVWAM